MMDGEKDGESWEYIIDAQKGNILYMASRIIHALSKLNAYQRHPNLDASYSLISPVPGLTGNGYVQGTYAYIYNDEGSEAYNAANDFRYIPSNTHFDEANLYYHIDRIGDYFHLKGFDNFTQIIAHAHHDFGDPNASYDPSDHHLRFSDGEGQTGFNSFALEDKIIYHEYTHAITDFVADLNYGYSEAGAIHEGNSDYFASTYTSREVIGEYATEGFEIYKRNIDDPKIDDYEDYNDENCLGSAGIGLLELINKCKFSFQ
jgi:Zn-dependent metalloprotease